jgi:hypothetical protein
MGEALRSCFDQSRDMEMARRAVGAYTRAAELSLAEGDARYTRELSELLVATRDSERLHKAFESFLATPAAKDQGERYVVLVDYADGLAGLGLQAEAWKRFEEAISLQPQNNVEAINRYARRLIDSDHPQKAAGLIESRLTHDQRIRHVQPAYLWREARQRAGMDTDPADEEIRLIESRRQGPAAAPPH